MTADDFAQAGGAGALPATGCRPVEPIGMGRFHQGLPLSGFELNLSRQNPHESHNEILAYVA